MPLLTSIALLALSAVGPLQGVEGKLVVVPFAAASGEVPREGSEKSARLLATELAHAGIAASSLELPVEPSHLHALEAARGAAREARALEAKRQFLAATQAWERAVTLYDEAAAIVEVAELAGAHGARGVALLLAGEDARAEPELRYALTLAPARPLEREGTSPLFDERVRAMRAQIAGAPKSSLVVETPVPARLLVDGQELGHTPARVNGLSPGKHLWQVRLPGREPLGGVVILASDGSRVKAGSPGTSPASRLNASLAALRLDSAAIGAARELADGAGAAVVAFGALRAEAHELVLDLFLLSRKDDVLWQVAVRYDRDLLSAAETLYALASSLTSEAPVGTRVADLPLQLGSPEAGSPVEVSFPTAGEAPKPVERVRKPIDPRKIVRP